MNKKQLLIAKSIRDKLARQINYPDCVISSRFNIPKTLMQLGIQLIGKDGTERPLIDIYNELSKKIELMEHHQSLKQE